ncbi:hypothetical protein Q8A73_000370 [Channa argus]|nr:hypothetical protein Q8A73_000370 [Channa argus]
MLFVTFERWQGRFDVFLSALSIFYGLSIQFIIHGPQAAASSPLPPPSLPPPSLSPPLHSSTSLYPHHHPLSVKADCFHASRVLRASTLSHYIRQRGEGERWELFHESQVAPPSFNAPLLLHTNCRKRQPCVHCCPLAPEQGTKSSTLCRCGGCDEAQLCAPICSPGCFALKEKEERLTSHLTFR